MISTQIEQKSGESKFKEDLLTYFPDLYKFWELYQFDKHMEQLLTAVVGMSKGESGTIKIIYQLGKINHISQEIVLTTNKKARQHY